MLQRLKLTSWGGGAFSSMLVLLAFTLICALFLTFEQVSQFLDFPLINSVQPKTETKRALVVSVSDFHYEVSIYFAWQFKSMDYDVTFWTIPRDVFKSYYDDSVMSQVAHRSSVVYEWAPFRWFNPRIPESIDALVFITAYREVEFFERLGTLAELLSHSKHQFFVNHHSSDAVNYVSIGNQPPKVHACPPPSCSLVHLAKHIGRAAKEFVGAVNKTKELNLVNTYPVYDLTAVFPTIRMDTNATIHKDAPLQLVIQGNVNSKRRHYDELIEVLRNYTTIPWKLQIIGHGASSFVIPADLKGRVKAFDGLSFVKFYQLIADADLVLAFLSEKMHYERIRATSTVPTAILANRPVLLTDTFIKHYSCLGDDRSSPLHIRIAQDTNAASLREYFKLSAQEKRLLKKEALNCHREWVELNRRELSKNLK
eukprot:gene6777-7487_t